MSTHLEILPIIQQYLAWYGWPIWLIFGSIGCLLNILLFCRRPFRTISCCLYFLFASVAMLIALGIGLIPLIYAFNHPSPYNTISSFCKTRNYLLQISAMMYRWLMAAACIDRFIHTLPNMQLQQLFDVSMTLRCIAIITLLCLILPFHQIVWTDVQNNICVFTNSSVGVYSSFFTIIMGGLLPPLVMFICAVLIRRNLVLKRRRIRHHQNNNEPEHRLRTRDQQALVMLFVQVLVYFISNLPWTINLVFAAFTRYMAKSPTQLIIESFIKSWAEFIWYMYPVLSFYMYTLISRTFRAELRKIFHCTVIRRVQQSFGDHRVRPTG